MKKCGRGQPSTWAVVALLSVGCSAEGPLLPPRGEELDVVWTDEGAVLHHPVEDLALAPTRWGRRGALRDLVLGAPVQGTERVTYAAGPVSAWFRERPDGLQHGFDVLERPDGVGPLEVHVRISGLPHLGAQNALYWATPDERIYARYDGLRAWDAEGRELNTGIDLACDTTCEAVLRVEDADAAYPIAIDPILATDETEGDIPADLEFANVLGSAMDLDGDWLGIWSAGTTSVVLYHREGPTWTAVQSIEDTDFADDVPWRFGRSIAIDGDLAAVGGEGAVYIAQNVGGVWTARAVIDKPDDGLVDPNSVSTFGSGIQLSGDTLVAPVTGIDGVYVFERDPASDVWSLSQTLLGTAGFGKLASLQGDRLLVAQYPTDTQMHVYERSGGTFAPVTVNAPILTGDTGLTKGSSHLLGDRIAIGHHNDNRVYLLERDPSGEWNEVYTGIHDTQSDLKDGIALFDGGLAYSSSKRRIDDIARAGGVKVWSYDGTWNEELLLHSDDPVEDAAFGSELDVDGAWLAVYEPRKSSRPYFRGQALHFYVLAPEDADGDGFAALVHGGNDCDDTDPAIHPDATEVPDNLVDEDCDGLAPSSLTTAGAGDLVITEIHVQPWLDGALDVQGQFIEVYNTSTTALLLDGVSIVTPGGSETLSTSAAVGPGEHVVLAASDVAYTNGGFVPDATWSSITLDPTGPIAVHGSVELDQVDLSGWTVPTGASLSLDPGSLDAVSNDLEASWCEGVHSYGDNFGTPGSPNVCEIALDIRFHWVLPDGSLVDGATDVSIAMDGTMTTGNGGEGSGSWASTSAGQTVSWTYDGTGVAYTGTRAHGATCFSDSSMTGLPGDTYGTWSEVGCTCVLLGDADGDGVCDDVDACPGADDQDDDDGDGIPNGCDICDQGDDSVDGDGDGVPDPCDLCLLGDDALDGDGDGVPDACDACEGFDDADDADDDGEPDGCDACPTTGGDDDRDGVCDDDDLCRGWDDGLDRDGDGIPDGCDEDDDCKTDGSGVWVDNPYFDDMVDRDPTLHVVSGLRPGACWTADGTAGGTVTVQDCTGSTDQDWTWSETYQTFVHQGGLCLDASGSAVTLSVCDASLPALGPDERGRIGLQDCSACLSARDLTGSAYTLRPVACEDVATDFGQRWGIDVQRDAPTAVTTLDDTIVKNGSAYHHVSVWGPYARALSRTENGNAYVAVGSTKGGGRLAVISSSMSVPNAEAAARAWVDAAPGTTQTYDWWEARTLDVDAVLDHLYDGGGVVFEASHPKAHWLNTHPVFTTYDNKSVIMREAGLSGAHYGYSAPADASPSYAQPLVTDTRYENLTGAIELAARTQLGLDSVAAEDLYRVIYSASTASQYLSNLEPAIVYTEALHRAMGYPEVTKANPHRWDDTVGYDDLVLQARFFRTNTLYPDQVDVPASVADYPGDPGTSEPRVSVTVTLDTRDYQHRFMPTGYYAPPGEEVAVFIESDLPPDAFLYAHWTQEWTMPRSCQLCPRSTARFPGAAGTLAIESYDSGVLNAPMGGPILLMARESWGPVTITLHNVLPQPHFVAGVDTDASFASELASSTVPFTLLEEENVFVLGHKEEIVAATDSIEEMITTLGDLWRAEQDFSGQDGWGAPHMFFFDLRVEDGGAHSGNPSYLSHAWELSASNPFWQTSFLGKWGFLHETGHSFSNADTPLFMWEYEYRSWREGEPNLFNMAAVDTVFGPGSHEQWSGWTDAERQVRREAFVCNCLDAGGCDATDFSTAEVVDFGMSIADDPTIGWEGLAEVYAAFEDPFSDQQARFDRFALLLSERFDRDFGPYMTAYQVAPSASVLATLDATYPIDWEADPLEGLSCP